MPTLQKLLTQIGMIPIRRASKGGPREDKTRHITKDFDVPMSQGYLTHSAGWAYHRRMENVPK